MTTVGILSSRLPNEQQQPFGRPTSFFEECCRVAVDLGIRVVVFDHNDVDGEQKTISPATVGQDGRWVECIAEPWPKVIYDRAPVLDPVITPTFDKIRYLFEREGIPFINPLSFIRIMSDKLETYHKIANEDLYVPHTECLNENTLKAFLDRYDHLYIKPRNGSQGQGILEIVRDKRDNYVIRTLTKTHEVKDKALVRHTIMNLNKIKSTDSCCYLVQQGISSEPPDKRNFPRYDLRLLMQKDSDARWLLTGAVARVSQTDGPTSNLSNGARAEEAESELDSRYGNQLRKTILTQATEQALIICRLLEKKLGSVGELGIDILPDSSGIPWVIEINAKPGRNVFKRIANSNDVSPSVRLRFEKKRHIAISRPFEYAMTLVGNPGLK